MGTGHGDSSAGAGHCWAGIQDSLTMALVPCIVISTGYILLVLFLCELARKLIAPLNPGLVKTALNEAIAAADLCGVCFELIIIADNYGLAAYGLYLFLATWWWALHWGDATACAYNHFESYIEGNMAKQEVIVRVVGQVIGGVAVFRLIQVLWAIEIAETHVGRAHSSVYNVCSADLTVPVLHGAIIEGVATWVCRIGSRLISMKEPQHATAIDSFIPPAWSALPSPPAADTLTLSSLLGSSLVAVATLPWSSLSCTGSVPPWELSPASTAGHILRKLSR